MDCVDIREQLLKGRLPDAHMVRHAETCPVCSELLADEGRTARTIVESRGDAPSLDRMLSTAIASVEAERGLVAELRSIQTPARWLIAIAAAALVAAGTFFIRPRPDLGVYPGSRMVLVVTALLVMFAAAVRASLWPLQVPNPSRRATYVVAAGALLVPIVLALLPAAHWAHEASLGGVGADLLRRAFGCFAVGLALALPLLLLFHALDRGAHGVMSSALIAAGAVGLSSNLALQFHCPLTHPAHLLLGHATIGVAAMAAYGLLVRRRRR